MIVNTKKSLGEILTSHGLLSLNRPECEHTGALRVLRARTRGLYRRLDELWRLQRLLWFTLIFLSVEGVFAVV